MPDCCLSECFDSIVCHTLDLRYHQVTIDKELAPLGGELKMFVVGDGRKLPEGMYNRVDVDKWPRRQAYNYAAGLIQILKQERERGTKRLLYLEDDAVLSPRFQEVFVKAWAELDALRHGWDLLYLGGNHGNDTITRLSRHIIRPTYSLDLHGVAMSERAFEVISAIEPSAEHTIDGVIAERQRKGELRVLAITPSIILQKVGWSYNENRNVNRSENH